MCLANGKLPWIWKLSLIVAVPKFSSAKEENDFGPIALTSIAINVSGILDKLDEHQSAYHANRSTKDA